jgi:hypothetical protein
LAGRRVTLPMASDGQLLPDGSGYVLSIETPATYDVRPDGIDRLTTGALAAVGAGRALALECSRLGDCSAVAMRIDGKARMLVDAEFPHPAAVGPISPDGRHAAILVQEDSEDTRLMLVDLRSGRLSAVPLQSGSPTDTGLAWAPDSSMLFALDAEGAVHVVQPSTGATMPLPVELPPLTVLAIRPATG